MPIYEYQCQACQHHMEAFQNISDPVLKKCPSCQKNKLKKLISAAGFHLKGEGWYVTDFRDKKTKTANKDEPATATASTEKTSTETKTVTEKPTEKNKTDKKTKNETK